MNEQQPSSPAASSLASSSIPQKRPAAAASTTDDSPRPRPNPKNASYHHREPREKKETWRKKESGGGGGGGGVGSNDTTPKGTETIPGLVRYRLPAPKFQDYAGHPAPPLVPVETPDTPGEWFMVNDHPMNRRGFRYTPCEASRLLPALAYRGTEYAPFVARINYEDMNQQVYINSSGMGVTTEKGWRMARANVGVREGAWYFECKILNGITNGDVSRGHVRIGWARREAPLDAPVGFDAYSYGLRDQGFDKVHMSRPRPFVAGGSFETGDVIGVLISLPTLEEQRTLTEDPAAKSGDIVRDRLPIRFKNQLWFESFEYQPTKEYEDLMNPAPSAPATAKPPPSSSSPTPKTLPGSYIRVYKNGELMGTPFTELFSFLPPASKPLATLGGRDLDDGGLGYYPAVSVFKGGAAELNLGPQWLAPPKELPDGGDGGVKIRPVCDRYNEQIAEDVTFDLVDEVDLSFSPPGAAAGGIGDATDTDDAGGYRGADGRKNGGLPGEGRKGEIKEMVIDDE